MFSMIRIRGRGMGWFERTLQSRLHESYHRYVVPSCRFTSHTVKSEANLEFLSGSDQGIAILSMNRPEARNAISRLMLDQMMEAIDTCRFHPTLRVLLLRSSVAGIFCAGADLKERAQMTPAETSAFVYKLRNAFSGLETLPIATIACIDGVALGGGLEMALACDMRVAGSNSVLGLPETALAIIPGAGGTQRLPRLIGASKAKELIFTARRIDASTAHNIGLVNAVAENSSAFETALELAREILPQGPIALRVAKTAIDGGMQMDRTSGMLLEQQCYAQVIPTKDRIEGLTAFKEKRKPVYRGE